MCYPLQVFRYETKQFEMTGVFGLSPSLVDPIVDTRCYTPVVVVLTTVVALPAALSQPCIAKIFNKKLIYKFLLRIHIVCSILLHAYKYACILLNKRTSMHIIYLCKLGNISHGNILSMVTHPKRTEVNVA